MKTSPFWDLLSAYEAATILEAKALGLRDFENLDLLNQKKALLLQKLLEEGRSLGLDRRHKVLRERLEALQQAESMNLATLAELMGEANREGADLVLSRRKLVSLRGAYAAGPSESEFYAEG